MFRMVEITAMWYSYGFNSMTYPIYIQQKFVQIIEHTNSKTLFLQKRVEPETRERLFQNNSWAYQVGILYILY